MKNLTWRDVLDCKLNAGAVLGEFVRLASDVGYKYIAWNGNIYFLGDEYNLLLKVGTVEELENGTLV